jgi:hypothetical protein
MERERRDWRRKSKKPGLNGPRCMGTGPRTLKERVKKDGYRGKCIE